MATNIKKIHTCHPPQGRWDNLGYFCPFFYISLFPQKSLKFSHELLQACSGLHMTTLGVILIFFLAHFDLCFYFIFEECSIFSLEILNRCSWHYTYGHCTKQFFFMSRLSLLWPILVYIPLFLESRSIFSHEILCRCLQHYTNNHDTKVFYSHHLLFCWSYFGLFLDPHFGVCPSVF